MFQLSDALLGFCELLLKGSQLGSLRLECLLLIGDVSSECLLHSMEIQQQGHGHSFAEMKTGTVEITGPAGNSGSDKL